MTISVNSDCSLFTFVADYLDNVVSPDPETEAGMVSLTLRYKTNCASGSTTTVDATDEIENITDNTLSLTPAFIYSSEQDVFCDGVYYLELETVYNVVEGLELRQYTKTDSACVFVDCDLKCKIIDAYAETKDANLLLLYDAIKYGIGCDSCNCSTACEFYTELKCLINEAIPSTTTTTNGCGCN